MRVKWARNNGSPSSSKPYKVLEPLPVWGGITEDDSLVRILSHCHGNNSCDQSALVRVDSGPPISPGILLQVNVGWTDAEERNCVVPPPPFETTTTGLWNNFTTNKETRRRDTFFAVSALWIEGNLSGLPLCDTKTLPMSSSPPPHLLAFCLFSHLFLLPPSLPSHPPNPPPCCHRPVLSWMLLCKPLLVERFFCPMLVMHTCKKLLTPPPLLPCKKIL